MKAYQLELPGGSVSYGCACFLPPFVAIKLVIFGDTDNAVLPYMRETCVRFFRSGALSECRSHVNVIASPTSPHQCTSIIIIIIIVFVVVN